ncbi:MAG TPA: threonine synthase [Hyphomicrobiaceae bacterium]|nr:threonine synthase [Hyphomicrobiaceae bacterium]
MRYISTRGNAPPLNFEEVLLGGLAADGGLYVPQAWPALAPGTIASFAGKPFAEVAAEVLAPFADWPASGALLDMIRAAYSGFGHAAVTPLVQIGPDIWVLELFHGPTLAFKDVAMQLLARMMDAALGRRGERATVISATSGDTGGAAVAAFRGSKHLDVVVLFPDGRISDVQRRMMTTVEDDNVHAIAVKGTFDDCQALVKAMFAHRSFKERVRLTAANSINWARIVAQTAYYFAAAVALGAPERRVSFSVPTGNFGDVFAGYSARRMGLPVEQLAIASNSNDILPRAFESGVYEMREVVQTSSPSMDIQVSSNFERYLFEAQGRDPEVVRAQMGALAQSRRFEMGAAHGAMRRDFAAAAASEAEVAAAIRRVRKESGYLMDPHTACGMVAAEKALAKGRSPRVVLATAHPAKFPQAMRTICGEEVELPARLAKLMTDRERLTVLPAELTPIERHIEERVRAARETSR